MASGILPGSGPPYGTGTSTTVPTAGGGLLVDPNTNLGFGSRRIDPVTKDYVINAQGRTVGMSDVQQLVHIAVSTDLGSSAVSQLGQQLKQIQRITANFERQVQNTLRASVQHLIDLKMIAVDDIFVERVGPSIARARMVWRDLTVDPLSPVANNQTVI